MNWRKKNVKWGRRASKKLNRIFSLVPSKIRVATSKIPSVVYEGSWRSFDRYGFYGSNLIIVKQRLGKARSQETLAGEGLMPLLVGDSHVNSFCIQQ